MLLASLDVNNTNENDFVAPGQFSFKAIEKPTTLAEVSQYLSCR